MANAPGPTERGRPTDNYASRLRRATRRRHSEGTLGSHLASTNQAHIVDRLADKQLRTTDGSILLTWGLPNAYHKEGHADPCRESQARPPSNPTAYPFNGKGIKTNQRKLYNRRYFPLQPSMTKQNTQEAVLRTERVKQLSGFDLSLSPSDNGEEVTSDPE